MMFWASTGITASPVRLDPGLGRVRAWSWLVLLLVLGLAQVLMGAEPSMRWRWSNPRPHGGNIFDMASKFGITVQVAERGQIYRSEDRIFWTPVDSGTRRSLRGVTFFGSRLIVTGEAGLVLYSENFEDFRAVDLPTDDWLEDVTASSDLLVAVGDNGAIYTSHDVTRWQRQAQSFSQWLRGVAYGGDHFVAVGENGILLVSENGTNWVRRNSGVSVHLNRVSWLGEQFWAVGDSGTVLVSEDGGLNWRRVEVGTSNRLNNAAGDLTTQLVVGEGEVRLNQNTSLLSWPNQINADQPLTPPNWTYLDALWNGESFFMAGRSGVMVEGFRTNDVSPFVWVQRTRSIRNWLWEVQRLPDFYVTAGVNGTIMTSENGLDWNLEWVPTLARQTVLLGVGGDTNLLVAVGNHGQILYSPNIMTNIPSTEPDGTLTNRLTSTLGIVWESADNDTTTNDLQGVTTFRNRYYVSGNKGTILSSDNGRDWRSHPTPTRAFLTGLASFRDRLIAVGQEGTVLVSPDGTSWSALPQPISAGWIYRVRQVKDRLIALGQNGTILSSTNGLNWIRSASPVQNWLNDVTYLAGRFYIVGNQGTVLASGNGQDWVSVGTITGKSLFGVSHHEGQLVTVGTEGVILRSQVIASMEPVHFIEYTRRNQRNVFLISGQPDQRIILENTQNFQQWRFGEDFEFLDSSGTLLILSPQNIDGPDREFYRARTLP